MAGRPRALDDTKRREVCALISAGCNTIAAAKFVGCHAITIRREALRNKDFFEDLRKAELAAQALPLQAIRKAASTHWRAAAWFLERTQPLIFGKYRPRTVTDDEVRATMHLVHEIIQDELPDPAALDRIWQKIGVIHNHVQAEQRAVANPRPDVHTRILRKKLSLLKLGPSKHESRRLGDDPDLERDAQMMRSASDVTSTDEKKTT